MIQGIIASERSGLPAVATAVHLASDVYLSRVGQPVGGASSSECVGAFWIRIASIDDLTGGSDLVSAGGQNTWAPVVIWFANVDGEVIFGVDIFSRSLDPASFFEVATVPGDWPGLGVWVHVAFSIDTNHAAGLKVGRIYLNRVASNVVPEGCDVDPAFAGDWGDADISNYRFSDSSPFGVVADLADLWLAPGQMLDLTNSADLDELVGPAGERVDLGADGSGPTGVAPLFYFSGGASAFPGNRGTGGAFTTNGTPADVFDAPA